ncbi:MAG: glycosyltransferase [Clostridia bacterium]|nr:glycosyltransferase [Clostridia bacterium]
MKKICIICETLSFGGIERVISILSDKLSSEYQLYVLTTIGQDVKYSLNQNVKILHLKNNSNNKIVNFYHRIGNLNKIINEERFDLCIAFGYKVGMSLVIASKVLKSSAKIILTERTDPDSYCNSIIKKVRDILFRKSDMFICQTEFVKDYYSKRGVKKLVVIPNPIKEGLPNPYDGERKKVIVNFCRLNEQKNLPLLIDAFEQVYKIHNDFKLVIYGEGSLKDFLLNYISNKNLSDVIEIHDFISNIHEVINDCFMFVSSSNFEGISNSMLEALALGLPCVCTDCPVGGASLAIEDKINGILVPIKDCNALTNAMKDIIENDALRNNISKNAVNVRERFRPGNISNMWKEIIERVFAD